MIALLNLASVLHVMRARYIYRHDRLRPLLLCALKNELHQFTLYLFIISHSELGQYSPGDKSMLIFNVVGSVAKFSVLFVVLFAIVHTFYVLWATTSIVPFKNLICYFFGIEQKTERGQSFFIGMLMQLMVTLFVLPCFADEW